MNIDRDAAAYGLFHLAYAVLDGRVRHCLYILRNSRDASVTPEGFSSGPFGKPLEELKSEISSLRASSASHEDTALSPERIAASEIQEELYAVDTACELARNIANWRNERIHPKQIRLSEEEHRLVLCDGQGRQLSLSPEDCIQKIHEAIHANVELNHNVERILRVMKWWNENYSTVFDDELEE